MVKNLPVLRPELPMLQYMGIAMFWLRRHRHERLSLRQQVKQSTCMVLMNWEDCTTSMFCWESLLFMDCQVRKNFLPGQEEPP